MMTIQQARVVLIGQAVIACLIALLFFVVEHQLQKNLQPQRNDLPVVSKVSPMFSDPVPKQMIAKEQRSSDSQWITTTQTTPVHYMYSDSVIQTQPAPARWVF